MSNLLTMHVITSIPWSNMNRDDSGIPKRLFQGGALRGQLSSQSIKRAARVYFENVTLNTSVRSGHLPEQVANRAQEIDGSIEYKELLKRAKKAIGTLTKSEDKSSADESSRSTWLSAEELEACAQAIVAEEDTKDIVESGKTGSLAIAAFGRMFANAPGKKTEAAIAVSPAVSTHPAIIETDYFSTVDDAPSAEQGAGSSFLGMAYYTNGVFYRTVTIDRAQLKESWTGITGNDARELLSAMVDALIYALPRGKKNSTAPYVMPALILAEEQAHRIAYDFERPVSPHCEGGYLQSTVDSLREQYLAARRFDPENFAGVNAIAGTFPDLSGFVSEPCTKGEFINQIVDWILQ